MATYKLIGQRFLRRYTASDSTPVYASAVEAQKIVDELCGVPWLASGVKTAMMTSHSDEKDESGVSGLDSNVANRESFDAALFCAGHVGGKHRAYANAAVYRYVLPDGTLPNLTSLVASITSDPYNAAGARIAIMTNSTGEIPTSCNVCRTGDAYLEGVAPRTSRTVDGTDYWYPTTAAAEFESLTLPLEKYLFVFALMESYSTVRGNWIEGCSFMTKNEITITTSAAVPGWADGETVDLSDGVLDHEFVVCRDGVAPDNVQEVSGVRSLQVTLSGSELVKKSIDIPAVQGGFCNRVGEQLKMIRSLDGEITCTSPFVVETVTNNVSSFHKFIAVGGTFSGGTFAEIDGLYLYSLDEARFIEGVALGANVPAWLKTFARDHGGFAHVTNILCHTINVNGFSCIGMDGCGVAYSATDGGIDPVFWFSLSDPFDLTSFVVETGVRDMSPNAKYIQDAVSLPRSARIISADRFSGTRNGGGSITFRNRMMALVGFQDGDELKLAFPFWYWQLRSNVTSIATDTMIVTPGITGRVTGVYCGGLVSGSADGASVVRIVVTGELTHNGQQASVMYVDVNHQQIIDSASGPGSVTLKSVTIPAVAASLVPNVVDGFGIRSEFVPGTDSLEVIHGLGSALVFGAFSRLGTDARRNSCLIDLSTGATSAADSDGAVTLPMLVGGVVYSGRKSSEAKSVEYYEAGDDSATGDQTAIGLRTLSFAFARSEGVAVPTVVTGSDRIGAAHNIRQATTVIPAMVDGVIVSQTVNVWRLTSSVMLLPFALPQTFTAKKLRLEWPEIDATGGAKFNVWIRSGHFTDLEATTDIRLFDASAPDVAGWRLLGTIDATDENREALLELGTIEGRGATVMLTAYIRPDGDPADTTYPIGAATDMDVDPIRGTSAALDSGWKPDITLIG